MSHFVVSALLTVSRLDIEVGERALIKTFQLSVEPGMLIEITGPNGCGKTTLLRYLAGIRRVNSGCIDIHNTPYVYIGQKPGLNASMTVYENLAWLTCNANQQVSKGQLLNALDRVGLSKFRDKSVGSLSAGQARRCSLALLLAVKAKLWLLDEPLTALDRTAINWLKRTVTVHRENRGGAIIATHGTLGLPDTTTIDLDAT